MRTSPNHPLRDDAIGIWRAGVEAVAAERLVRTAVLRVGADLVVAGERCPIGETGRIAVVGAGKAGAGMAAAIEAALAGDRLESKLTGWVNVPDDCVRTLSRIHLHPARPAGVNEPTAEGAEGARRILEIARSLKSADVCLVLLSGGGSALLPAPVPGVTLADKQEITRGLSRAGASIEELNCVRKQLSQIKGGRLALACGAGTLISLIISDVIGDPLDVIASGPTVPDSTTPADALSVLRKYADRLDEIPESVMRHLSHQRAGSAIGTIAADQDRFDRVRNHVIGNIDVALAAAEAEARGRGYEVHSLGGRNRGVARDVGSELARQCLVLRDSADRPQCLLSGGEPTVHVVPTHKPRKGGRNQELILAAVKQLWDEETGRIALLSGGTDGEDGPTDAAGAYLDIGVIDNARRQALDPDAFLAINNSYGFFEQVGGHLKTGPTHTNVMDLRVGVVVPAGTPCPASGGC